MGGRKGEKKTDWSQQEKTRDRKEEREKTKKRALYLNMHISSVGDHGEARGEEVTKECERTLTDRWSQHAVSFD